MDVISKMCSPAGQVADTNTQVRGRVSAQEHIGLGWSSPELTGVTVDGLWEALTHKARKPEQFMDVSNVKVEDRDQFLFRSMFVKASNKTVIEHIYCNERKGEMVYRVVDPKTKRESKDERVIAVKQRPLHLEFYHRHVSDGYRSYWPAPTKVVEGLVTGITALAKKLENNSDERVGLGIHSAEITDVSHDALWKAMVECIREPQRFMKVQVVSIQDKNGFVQRTTSLNNKQVTDNIYVYEQSCEIVYRVVNDGVEGDLERVVALRTHPLQIEFHARNRKDGFRVDWQVPKKAALSVVESYVKEGKRLDKETPTVIGYGITSDPVRDASFDSLMIAVNKTITDPALVHDIVPKSVVIREENGYIIRRFQLKANNETVMEKVTINEEAGEVTYNKLLKDGNTSDLDRVLAIHRDPLRIEFYERNKMDNTRCDWQAPYKVAVQTLTQIVTMAKKIESMDQEVIGYGISSKAMAGLSQDSLWKAMLFCIRNPDRAGMNVSNVKVFDNDHYMTRFMNLTDKKDKPLVIDNVYVDEESQEIKYRVLELKRGGESLDERIFAIRTSPLRCEMWCRHAKDELRVDWQAPKAVAQEVFNKVGELAMMMQNDPVGFEKQYASNLDDSKESGAANF